MDIDYKKIVEFLFNDNSKKTGIDIALKEILKKYCMINVDQISRTIMLKSRKTERDFILKKRKNSIIILPTDYMRLSLNENFEEIIEIRLNDDNDVVVSNIDVIDNPKGIYVSGSNWHNEGNNTFTQVVGRIIFIDSDSLIALENRLSIEMFISKYDMLRNDIFCDLYWDINSLIKSVFIEPKKAFKVQVNDGFTKEEFNVLYEKYTNKVKDLLSQKLF
jgi:hypothetical protein